MRRLKLVFLLSFGLVSLTLAIFLTAYLIGLIPNKSVAELEARVKVAEALSVQLAGAANRNDGVTLEETLSLVVGRNDDVISAALRSSDGSIIISAGEHEKNWVPNESGRSTPTHITVPLIGEKGNQGAIEISFGSAFSDTHYLGIPVPILTLLAFLAATCFLGYFLILKRSLHELDPGRVIPERVQKAFDTLNECVLILDEKQRILLANKTFMKLYGTKSGIEIGSKIGNLQWRNGDVETNSGAHPWHTAILQQSEIRGELMSLRIEDGGIFNFNVNATAIVGEKNKTIGAIVTLFEMTDFKRNKEDLEATARELEKTQSDVERKTKELSYLTSHDPFTGCINRRTFFRRLDRDLDTAMLDVGSLSLFVVDLDDFKAVNERYGPVAADSVLLAVSSALKSACSGTDYVARIGGQDFGVVRSSLSAEEAIEFADGLREKVIEESRKILPGGQHLTISVGIAEMQGTKVLAQDFLGQANAAVQCAKSAGKNMSVRFEKMDSISPKAQTSESVHTIVAPEKTENPTTHSAQPSSGAPALSSHEIFVTKAAQSLEFARNNEKPFVILKLSVVSWDYLVEALGGHLSSELMASIKEHISTVLRENDTISCRVMRGEVLIEVGALDEAVDTNWIISELLSAARLPNNIAEKEIFVECRIGAAIYPDHGHDVDTLVRNADVAMRRAIEANHLDGFKLYEDGMVEDSLSRLNIEHGIRGALSGNGFALSYQPIVDAKTGHLTGAECLLRCECPDLQKYRMDNIISVAEKSSLITEIDIWVFKTALAQMKAWCDVGLNLPKISINVSAKQITNVGFMDNVYKLIKAFPYEASRIQIEVTESVQATDLETAHSLLKRVQQLGVFIAIDDFGTGQASLSYLQKLGPDLLKIDRSFVTDININHSNATMVTSVIVMAKCLGIKTVAEGIETEAELEFLRSINCDAFQGYLISKPMPVDVMTDWLGLFGPKEHKNLSKNVLEDVAVSKAKAA